ncbi:hypothetical protein WA556_002269, partial [Blastocystis sp. ATCC 50177/Nand II]
MNNRLLESLRNGELSTSRDVYAQIKSVLENGNDKELRSFGKWFEECIMKKEAAALNCACCLIATYYKKVSVFISEDTWSALSLLLGEQENDSLDAFTLMQL